MTTAIQEYVHCLPAPTCALPVSLAQNPPAAAAGGAEPGLMASRGAVLPETPKAARGPAKRASLGNASPAADACASSRSAISPVGRHHWLIFTDVCTPRWSHWTSDTCPLNATSLNPRTTTSRVGFPLLARYLSASASASFSSASRF